MTKATVILQTPVSERASKFNKFTLLSNIRDYFSLKENETLKVENYKLSYIKNIDTLFLEKQGFRRQLKDLTLKVLQQVLSILQKEKTSIDEVAETVEELFPEKPKEVKKPYFLKFREKHNDYTLTERSGFICRIVNSLEDILDKTTNLLEIEPKGEQATKFFEKLTNQNLGLKKDNGTRTGLPESFNKEEKESKKSERKLSVEVTEKEVRVLYEEDLETLLEKDNVELKGFLLSISMPSEARLQQRLSKNQITELEELISSATVRDITFSFFDNRFSNKIKGIRRDLYTKVISDNCVKIQHIENTILYLLPYKNVNPFILSIEKLNVELLLLKEEIKQEQEILENNASLQNILNKYDIKIKQVNLSGWKIYYQLDPIKIDKRIVKEMLSDKAIKKYVSQLEERNKQILTSLESELLKRLKMLLTKLGRKFTGEGLHYRALDYDLALLENKSDAVGLSNLSTLTHTLRTFLKHTQEKNSSSLEACAQEISRLVRMPKHEKPRATIELGLNKLNNIVDTRISSLQRKMIQESEA